MSMSFFLKKFLEKFFYPSGLVFLFLFLTLIYVVLDKRKGRRRLLLFLGLMVYYFCSIPLAPYFFLKHLETKYTIPDPQKIQSAKFIVVLTGRIFPYPGLSIEERFGRETLIRFLKGIELKKKYPDKKLIIIGGSLEDKNHKGASFLKEFAKKFGVTVTAIDTALDTIQSAKVFKRYLKSQNATNSTFLLLTSAYHLPRSVYLFKHFGLHPIPYPTNYDYKLCEPTLDPIKLVPDPYYLVLTNYAIHEYLGLTYYKIKFFLEKHF